MHVTDHTESTPDGNGQGPRDDQAAAYPLPPSAQLGTQGAHLTALQSGVLPTLESIASQLAWRDAEITRLQNALASRQGPEAFRVGVQTYEESCGTSYLVTMTRPDRAPDAKPWDPGAWTLSQHDVEENAQQEAEELRLFLNPQVPLSDL